MPTSPNYTLTGVIETVTGSADQGKVRLQLAGYGAQVIPSVTGTAQFPDPIVEATCDVTGTWSATVFGCDQYYQDNNPDPLYYDITPISGDGTTGNTVPYRLVGGGSHDITALIPYVVPAPATTPTKTEYIGDVFVSGIPSTRQMLTGLTSTVADWEYPVPEEIELSRYLASVAPGKIIHAAAVTSSGSAIVTVASGYSVWTSADVGKKVRLTASRVNSPGTDEFHTIASVQGGTQITLNSAVTNSDTSVTVEWWSSSIETAVTAALASAMAACRPGQQTIKIPDGVYPVTSYPTWNVYCKTIRGGGVSSSRIVPANATVTGSLFPISSSGWVSIRDIGLTGPMYQDGTVITAYSITSNVVTFTATNTFTAGQVVLIQGFLGTGAALFNNTKFTILASGLSGSQFAANFTNADTSGTDTGVACVDINCIVTPSAGMKHLDMERVEISYWPGSGIEINPVFLSSFREVTVHHCGADFNLLPVSGSGVTTTHFDTCWGFKAYKAGFYTGKGSSVHFSNCGADRCGVNLYADGTTTVTIDSFDSEGAEWHNAAYPGYHYWNHGAKSFELDQANAICYSYSDARSTMLVMDNSAKRVWIRGFNCDSGVSAVLPTNAYTIDSTVTNYFIDEFGFGIIATTAFVDNGTLGLTKRNGAYQSQVQYAAGINVTAGDIAVKEASGGLIKVSQTADTFPRVTILNDGTGVHFGTGAAGTDVNIQRNSGGMVSVNGVAGGAFNIFTTGNTNPRIGLYNDGTGIGFGTGSAGADVFLSRLAANKLAIGTTGSGSTDAQLDTNIFNAITGFRIGGVATTAGHVLRANGTNYVDSALAAADLSNGVTGSGAVVLATSPTLVTPVLGVAAATTINKITLTTPATGSTLTIVDGKTLTISNTLTFVGTDAQTYTFPSTSATIARTDAANTFTGHQTIEGVTSTGATGTGKFVFDGSPTLVTPVIGVATGTSLSNSKGSSNGVNAMGNTTGATNVDLSLGNTISMTLTGAATFTWTNGIASRGTEYTFVVTQDATGGRVITWPAQVAGITPIQNLIASGVSVFKGVYDGTNMNWIGAANCYPVSVQTPAADTLNAPNNATTDFATTYALPANLLTTGRVIKVTVGLQQTSSGGVLTISFKLKVGSTVVYASTTGTQATAMTNHTYSVDFYIVGTAAPGASVNVVTTQTTTPGASTAALTPFNNGNTVAQPVALATNGALTITPEYQASVNTAGNSLQLVSLITQVVA